MEIVTELITTAAIVLIVHLFLQGFFPKREIAFWIRCIGYLSYGAGLFILGRSQHLSWLRLLFNTGYPVLMALVLFEARPLPAVFAGISASGIFVLAEMLMIGILSMVGLNPEDMMWWDSTRYVVSIATQLLSLLLVLTIRSLTERKRSAITLPFLLLQLPGGIAGIWMGCELGFLLQQGETYRPMPFIIAAGGLIYMNILMVFYAERAKRAADREKEQALAEHHYAMQAQYYEQLRCEQNETRAVFHDIHKYLKAMRALIDTERQAEAAAVLDEANRLTGSLGGTVDVGNAVISVILNEYSGITKEKSIDFSYDISIPPDLALTAVDAYILLGNTLDNAIEACMALEPEKRYIRLQLRLARKILFYSVKNSCGESTGTVKGKERGFGLKNVQKCVRKYQGDIAITRNEGCFVFNAHLILTLNKTL